TLYAHETDPALEGLERGVVTNLGAVNVDTGKFTGRSVRSKYFVVEETSKDNVWWKSASSPSAPNSPVEPSQWEALKTLAVNQLNGKRLYVVDGFAGTNPDTRLSVRVICEVAWQAHF